MTNEKIGIFLPVSEVFDDISNDFETFKSLLGNLSRTDALFWCARINLIISDPEVDHITKQQTGLNQFFTPEEIKKVNNFVSKNGGAERITVFFRGQILELIRWIVLYSNDFPDDGIAFENSEMRRNFAKAILIAGDIWSRRVFGKNRFSLDDGMNIARRRSLGLFERVLKLQLILHFYLNLLAEGGLCSLNIFQNIISLLTTNFKKQLSYQLKIIIFA